MNQLEKWNDDGVISLRFPEHAQNEAEASGDVRRTKKARAYWMPQTTWLRGCRKADMGCKKKLDKHNSPNFD